MSKWLSRSLKYLALMALFTLFVPFIAIGHLFVAHKTDNAAIMLYTLLITAVGCCGGLVSYVIYRLQYKIFPVVLNIVRILLGINIAAAVALLASDNIIFSIILFPLCSVAYFIGGQNFLLSYSDILTKKKLAFAIVSTLIISSLMWIISSYFSYSYDLSLFAPIFLFFTIVFFLVLNQANIDDLMLRRHHKLSHLPLKIRYYNLFLSLAVLFVIVIGYIFKDSVIAFILWVGDLVRLLFKLLFDFILWLMSFGNKGGDISMTPPSGGNDSGTLVPQEGSSSWNILYLVFGVAIISLLIFYRKDILFYLRQKFQALSNFIKEQLSKLTIVKNLVQSSSDYVDTVESLDSDVKKQNIDTEKISLKSWKKSHQKFIKMENSVDKLRYGYHLILRGLTLSGVEIIQSDTTIEIMRKTNNSILALDSTTNSYNNIRYGDFQPNINDINNVEDTLTHLRTSIANKPSEPKKRK